VFSFNYTVGPRTAAGGYQTAGIIVGKRLVSGIGGGICQTSSTLYNTVLESGLPVLERHTHSLRVGYVPANRDATVSWGTADMKFRNDKPYSIKILAQVYGNYVICALAAVDYQEENDLPL
jgi:vancomycin resistance protein YoaR